MCEFPVSQKTFTSLVLTSALKNMKRGWSLNSVLRDSPFDRVPDTHLVPISATMDVVTLL
jgi:hypothetical protein